MATIGMLRRLARELRLRLRRTAHVGRRPVVLGSVRVRGTGRITIGDEVCLDAAQAPIDLHAGPGAEIVLERGVVIEAGCSIESMESVRIGEGARIGAFTKIMDNHFHPLEGDRADRPDSRAVIVEPGASVGPRAVILPGTHIGRGARVGAGSVVSRRIPDGADVHGFPLQSRKKAG